MSTKQGSAKQARQTRRQRKNVQSKKEVKALVKAVEALPPRGEKAYARRDTKDLPLPRARATVKADAPYVRDLMHAILSPKTAPGDVRLADVYDTEPTAVLNPFSVGDVPFAKTDTVPDPAYVGLIPAQEAFVVSAPSALQNLIMYDPNPGKASSVYNYVFSAPAVAPSATLVSLKGTGSEAPLPVAYLAYSTGQKWHGQILATSVHGEGTDKFVWLGQGDQIGFRATFGSAGTMDLVLHQWLDGSLTTIQDLPLVASGPGPVNISTTINWPGWYTVTYNYTSNYSVTSFNGAVTYNNLAGHMCFRMAQSLDTILPSFTDFRMLGQSFLATNVAPEIQRGGTIAQCQLGMGDMWWNYLPDGVVTPGTFSTFSPFAKVGSLRTADAQRDAAKGSYVWRKPATLLWSAYQDEFSVQDDVLMDTHVQLVPKTGAFIVWTASVSAADAGLAQQFRYTTASYMEAKTTDVSRPQAVSAGAPIAVIDVQSVLRITSQYSENPLHVAAIIEAIRRGVSTVAGMIASGAPAVAAAVSKIGEVAGAVKGVLG